MSPQRDAAEEFVVLGCLCHDDPHYDHRRFQEQAREMLRNEPRLGEATVWTAAAAGNAAAVAAWLDREPDLVNRGGPYGWTPLICACYSRVNCTLEAARLLLDRGADPNAYTLKGNADPRLDQTPRRFTALAGVFGGGSTGLANQPPHSRWRELAELLLGRGADPADAQAIVLNADASLEILLRHGLKPDAMRPDGISLMGRELALAARKGNAERVRLLLEHGARTDERFEERTAWEQAMLRGHLEIARMLEAAGARAVELNAVERFTSLCLAGDGRGARAMLAHDPGLLVRAPKDIVHRAVDARRAPAVRLAIDLGFDPNYQEDNPPLTMTGVLAEREDILRILLEGGASLEVRDVWYDSTAVGWADFFERIELRDKLLDEPGLGLLDALDFGRFNRVPEILARDPGALERPFAECIARPPRPEDFRTPLARAVARGNTEAVRVLLEHGADAKTRFPDGRTLVEAARESGFSEISRLLEAAC